MRSISFSLTTALSIVLAPAGIQAATVSFSRTNRQVSSAEIASFVPFDTIVNDYFVTTDADIISFNMVMHRINHEFSTPFSIASPEGSDSEPPDPAAVAQRPALGVDSWITTPGPTLRTVKGDQGSFPGGDTWSDVTNDGPQTRFQFARYSTPINVNGFLEGSVTLAGANGPETFPFSLRINFTVDPVPEPRAWALASLGAALLAIRRRDALQRVYA